MNKITAYFTKDGGVLSNINEFVNKVICGDCLQIMGSMPDETVDLIATDPPYGMSFMGKEWDRAVPSVETWKECLRVLKSGAFAFAMSIPRVDCLGEMSRRLQEAGFYLGFTPIFWCFASGFPKAQNIGKAVDKRLGTLKVVGVRKDGMSRSAMKPDKGWHNNKMGPEVPILDPNSPQAKALDGSYGGFQPKPAVEVIIVAMKPLSEKTYVDQALKNGKGITWLVEGRIPIDAEVDKTQIRTMNRGIRPVGDGWGYNDKLPDKPEVVSPQGRFPANLLVSDDVLNDERNHSKGGSIIDAGPRHNLVYGEDKRPRGDWQSYGDSGSFSRFFDLDKWFSERIKELPESVQRTFPFLIVPKAGKGEKNKGVKGLEKTVGHNRFDKCLACGGYILQNPDRPSACHCENPVRQDNVIKGNYHPTVKPVKLMSYLITLGSREGDIVLDPFAGTCTTGIACKLLGRDYIMVEIEPEDVEIGKRRLEAWESLWTVK